MNTFGLTGNMGCGKSTVAKLLAEYPDVVVVDCDRTAKEIISDPRYKQEINAVLETEVFPLGVVNLKLIAEIIFKGSNKRKLLESFVHPLVWQAVQEKVEKAGEKICVVESAIIFETQWEDRFAGVIVATCSHEEQIRRLQTDRKMSLADIEARLTLQIPSVEKEKKALFVISTECDLDELRTRVCELYQNLKEYRRSQS
jgi:dephospho-CoA kinase